MKKSIIIFWSFFFAACSTVPIKQPFPSIPSVLSQKCEQLSNVETDTLSELLKTVTNNYQKYHNCAALVEAWQEWYDENKVIFGNQ